MIIPILNVLLCNEYKKLLHDEISWKVKYIIMILIILIYYYFNTSQNDIFFINKKNLSYENIITYKLIFVEIIAVGVSKLGT